jgi:hypothetical protein
MRNSVSVAGGPTAVENKRMSSSLKNLIKK